MAINWFPGHMNKAKKQIQEAMPSIDIVVEVLDARIPYSSTNPLVNQLREDKPCIKVLNKADLADKKVTQQWIEYYQSQPNTTALALVAEERKQSLQLVNKIKQLAASKLEQKKNVRVMIMGIPNVGKSTLINALAGRYIANTGNEPAVTKRQQMIDLKNGVILADTPGILWPKFENPSSGYRLAVTGAVKNTAMEYEEVAQFALAYLGQAYPDQLNKRFKLNIDPASDKESEQNSGDQLLDLIARKRGCLRPGGILDLHKAAELLLHEYRDGKIGLISLETPEMAIQEEELRIQLLAEKIEREKAEKEARKSQRQQKPQQY